MVKDRDLLPWIFGGLSMAAAAMAITLASTYGNGPGNAPKDSQTPSPITAHPLPWAQTPTAPAGVPAPAPAAAPGQAPVAGQIQTLAPPTEPGSQIWECTINGQKTFSDNPCGDKPVLREVGPINGMDPAPLLPRARSLAPESGYRPEYTYPGEQVDSYPDDQQSANNSYPVYIGIPYREHSRPDHGHRPHNHDHGPPRRN
jgi:hypothetical protein